MLDILVSLAEMYTSGVWWRRWTGWRLEEACRFAVRLGGLNENADEINITSGKGGIW